MKSSRGNPVVAAFCDEEVQVEAHSDGSAAKITSDLNNTVAKVYSDLVLPESKVIIPKGTVLRTGETRTAINDPEIERRLDAIEKRIDEDDVDKRQWNELSGIFRDHSIDRAPNES